MSARWWYGIATFVLLLALANAWCASRYAGELAPRLVVIARYTLPEHHKITDGEVTFAIRRERETHDAVVRPSDAVGACTRTTLSAQAVPTWQQLDPAGTGDASCASAALALDMLARILRLPGGAARATTQPAADFAIAPLSEWLNGDALPHNLPSATTSALGEFRAELIKELAKRLADNAGDHVFGRDRINTVKDTPTGAPLTGPPPPVSRPPHATTSAKNTTVQFGSNQSQLTDDMQGRLEGFTDDLRQQKDCRVIVEAFTDASGTVEQNQRMAWQRGGAVADLLVRKGIAAKQISVVPHVAGPARGKPNPQDRRADVQATCVTN